MKRLVWLVFASLLALVTAVPAEEMSGRERRIVAALDATIRQAGQQFAAKEFAESAESIRRAIKQVNAAMKVVSPSLYDGMTPAMDRIATAHALLELEGVMLPPFRRPTRPEASSEAASAAVPEAMAGAEPSPGGAGGIDSVSFVERVAPILVNRCGRCHVEQSRGDFSLASYAALMRGTPAGVVVFPGDVVASRLIETIETGDMPRGGGSVPADELATLKDWILSGAKFDGADPAAPLRERAVAGAPAAEMTVQRPTGSETVSFASDVAPLLVSNCGGCHIDARQAQGGLRLDNFAQLIRGGDSGSIIIPGKGDESLLVQKLRGSVGQRMPSGGRPALSEDSIALISTWIDEGARLDGPNEDQPLKVMVQLAWAASATTEQKSDRRAELAERSWRLARADGRAPQRATSEHFLVVGDGSAATMQRVAEAAEGQLREIRRTVSGAGGADFFEGRATIFVFPRRYDYSEFAKMVERRGIPNDWMAHWRSDGIDAYVAVAADDSDDAEVIGERLVGPLTSLAIAARNRTVPRWFAEGVGTALAMRLAPPRDRQERQRIEAETAEAVAAMESGKRFLEGKLTPRQSDRIGAAVASSLIDRPLRRGFDQLIRQLDGGVDFDDAFVQAFRLQPADFLDRWLGRPARSN